MSSSTRLWPPALSALLEVSLLALPSPSQVLSSSLSLYYRSSHNLLYLYLTGHLSFNLYYTVPLIDEMHRHKCYNNKSWFSFFLQFLIQNRPKCIAADIYLHSEEDGLVSFISSCFLLHTTNPDLHQLVKQVLTRSRLAWFPTLETSTWQMQRWRRKSKKEKLEAGKGGTNPVSSL